MLRFACIALGSMLPARAATSDLAPGNEIGDNCAYLYNFEHLVGHTYQLQTEYSNIVHGCVADYIP